MNFLKCALPLFLFLLFINSLSAQDFRDWEKYPAIEQIDTEEAIYVVGDVHGDYKRFTELLAANGLISGDDGTKNWEGGQSVLVVVGDLISKWKSGIPSIFLIQELQKQAEKVGGKVIVVAGNHEVEFMEEANDSPCGTPCNRACQKGFKKAKTKKFVEELAEQGINPQDVAKGCDKKGIGQFLKNMPFAARVNDWFFVHAGLPEVITLSKLEAKIKQQVNLAGLDADILLSDNAKNGILGVRMKSPINKKANWWNPKGEADGNPEELRRRVFGLSEGNVKIKHLVFGHQPKKYKIATNPAKITRPAGTIFQAFNALVILVDVGMSRGVFEENMGAILKIKDSGKEVLTILYPDGTEKPFWAE